MEQCPMVTIQENFELSLIGLTPVLGMTKKQESDAIEVRYLEWYPTGMQQVGRGTYRRNEINEG